MAKHFVFETMRAMQFNEMTGANPELWKIAIFTNGTVPNGQQPSKVSHECNVNSSALPIPCFHWLVQVLAELSNFRWPEQRHLIDSQRSHMKSPLKFLFACWQCAQAC
jgi:hypothetical protein